MPVRPSTRVALVSALVVLATGSGSGVASGAESGSASLRAEVEQLRGAVAATADELGRGAAALEAAQARHAGLVQRSVGEGARADEQAQAARLTRSRVRTLARKAYMGGVTPRLPLMLLLTNDLGAVADLAYLRRTTAEVGAAQGQELVSSDRAAAAAAQRTSGSQAVRQRALVEQRILDAQLIALSDRAGALDTRLQATAARLQTRLAAERLATLTAAAQRRGAAAAAARAAATAAQQAALDASRASALGESFQLGSGGPGGCLPPGLYGAVNGFLPDEALCPLVQAPGHRLQTAAAQSFDALSAARRAATGQPLCVTDSYRSYGAQVDVFRRKPSLAATPGRSQHGWGLAVDLCGGAERFGSEAHSWLKANAPSYGWIHPAWAAPGGSRPEAWHWEYAGPR